MKIIKPNLKFKSLAKGNIPRSIVLHHADSKRCTIEDIHRWHLNKGWSGCGYHYFVRKDGSVYKGRPDYVFGAHCLHHNTNTIGICAEGAYEVETMPEAQKKAIIELVNYLKSKYKNISKVYGHRELKKTACPGKNYPLQEIKKGQQSSGEKNKYLKIGSKGNEVKELQIQLQELGFYIGKIDGHFGTLTGAAVRKLQDKARIKVDGVVGSNTIKALESALKAKSEAIEEEQKKFAVTKELQKLLDKYDFDCGKVDGYPGALTKGAIDRLVNYLY